MPEWSQVYTPLFTGIPCVQVGIVKSRLSQEKRLNTVLSGLNYVSASCLPFFRYTKHAAGNWAWRWLTKRNSGYKPLPYLLSIFTWPYPPVYLCLSKHYCSAPSVYFHLSGVNLSVFIRSLLFKLTCRLCPGQLTCPRSPIAVFAFHLILINQPNFILCWYNSPVQLTCTQSVYSHSSSIT